MKYKFETIGKYYKMKKGLGYLGKYLTESSVGLIGLNSFEGGGGYKYGGEKQYSGPFKSEHIANIGDLFISTTDITQDGRVLASPFILPDLTEKYKTIIFSGDIVKAEKIKDGLMPEFLFNVLRVKKFREKAAYASSGTTVRRIPADVIESLEIPVPILTQQKFIVTFMNLIDLKVRNNFLISTTLQDMAQTIFKSWFIDFDPVKAKMDGEKPTGMDDESASLFPDSFEDSELGLIPKGWEWSSIGNIAEIIDCLHSKKPILIETGFPYLQLDTISDSGVLLYENASNISKEDYDKWTSRIEVKGGDCVITNVGRVGAVSQVPEHFKAAIGRNITALRPKEDFYRSYLIIALLSDFIKKEIKLNTDSGTILEALNVRNIPKLKIPLPNVQLLQRFESIFSSVQLQIQVLHKQNVQLVELRDSLLPRLISGELQIPEEMLAS
jgi:type I restriction enzyme S subunit